MSALQLWSWQLSPFAGKVRVACAEKGVSPELLEIDPRHRPARLRELNPTATVPVLEVDGRAIRESSAICDWLEETHPDPSFWPSDPVARGAARGLLRWVDDELTRNFFLSVRKEAFGVDRSDHPEIVDILRARLAKRWGDAERLLDQGDGTWIAGGEAPTYADLAAIPLAVRLPQWKPELQPDATAQPLSAAWLERLRQRPSAAAVDQRGEPVAG
jgi:glutathione S-transferase